MFTIFILVDLFQIDEIDVEADAAKWKAESVSDWNTVPTASAFLARIKLLEFYEKN